MQIFLKAQVKKVDHSSGFEVRTQDAVFSCGALVVATGGLSIPKMGATPFGYQLATQFGIAIQPCRPALVPLLFSSEDLADYGDLAGVAVPVIASCGARQFRENLLFTHRGLSGPAILQISSYWKPGKTVEIDLAPDTEWTEPWRDPLLPRNLTKAKELLRATLPHRLADRWLALHPIDDWTNRSLIGLGAATAQLGRSTRRHGRIRKSGSHRGWRSTPMNFPPKQWSAEKCRACFLLAK